MCFEDMKSKVSKKCELEDQKKFQRIFMEGTIGGTKDVVEKHCKSKNYPYNLFFGSSTSGLKRIINYQLILLVFIQYLLTNFVQF